MSGGYDYDEAFSKVASVAMKVRADAPTGLGAQIDQYLAATEDTFRDFGVDLTDAGQARAAFAAAMLVKGTVDAAPLAELLGPTSDQVHLICATLAMFLPTEEPKP